MSDNDKSKKSLYSVLVNVRNTELTTHWTRYSIQAILNIGLLTVVLSVDPSKLIPMPVIAIGGLVLATIWFFFTLMGKKLLTERWEKYIKQYERDFLYEKAAESCGGRNDKKPIRLFTNVEEEESKCPLVKNWRNLNILAWGGPILCAVAWIIILFRVITLAE